MNKSVNAKTLNTYLGLCTEVYELSKPEAPSDAYNFYREYAAAAKGPILEPMCGTGRFLIPLLEGGFNIHGFDASEYMLERLYEKAKAKGLKADVWHDFVQGLTRPEKYELIFIPSGSFCLITDPYEARTALKKFCKHLNDDGIFLFEIETLKAVPPQGIWRGSVWTKPNGQKIILSGLTTLRDDICTSTCKYELVEAGSIIHTEIEEYNLRIYEQNQLVEMLKAAGFNHIRTLKAFDNKKQPDEQGESIVYECRK